MKGRNSDETMEAIYIPCHRIMHMRELLYVVP